MNAYEIKSAGVRARSKLLAIPEDHNGILYVRLLINGKSQQTILVRADLFAELGQRIIKENGYAVTQNGVEKLQSIESLPGDKNNGSD